MTSQFEAELEQICNEYDAAKRISKYDDCSDVLSRTQIYQLKSRCTAAVERASGRTSVYYAQLASIDEGKDHQWDKLAAQVGVVQSLIYNIQNGHLRAFEELVHGELFGDFLEMARHLNDCGYKDAAAVIAGSTLEAHLRQLCKKASISVDHGGRPKKADTINAELATAGLYLKLDQKNVVAWLDLRNNSAHGHYDSYDKNQVSLMVSGIRDFITRNSA